MMNDWTLADDRMEEMLKKNCTKHGAIYIDRDDSKLGNGKKLLLLYAALYLLPR